MAVPALTEIMLGAFAYFIPEGTTVDSVTVSKTVKPDNDPTTNWTAYTIGDVLNFKFDKETVDIQRTVPLASGGYTKINKMITIQDWVILKTAQMGELVHRLQFGLASAIATGTAQTPFIQNDRKIEGWLRIQGRQLGGTDRFVIDCWCECRLEETAEFNAQIVEPVLRFTEIKGVALNSVNFPSGS
jgi:hypothetical protein